MTPTETRLILREAGYQPIPCRGKNPGMMEKWAWQLLKNTSREQVEGWERNFPDAKNTGLLTCLTPTFDIDIKHPGAATAIEEMVRERFEERGYVLVRFGLRPKRAIPFRTDAPFKKIVRNYIAPGDPEDDPKKWHKLEFLADGQQFIAFGIHPDTREPYEWFGGEPGQIKHEDLPYITGDEALRLFDTAERVLIDNFGFKLKPSISSNGGGEHKPGDDPQADIEPLRKALDVIPNTGDWDSWNNIGMAIWRATGGSGEGFELFNTWSRKSEKKHNAQNTSAKWTGYHKTPPNSIGAGTIFHLAKQYEAKPAETTTPILDPWERYIVPDFPLEILPAKVQDYIVEQSEVIGCDRSGFAMSALATFSGALSHEFKIKMMRHGNWYERPRLWVLLVGDPSQRKTPIMTTVTRPLVKREEFLRRKFAAEMRHYEIAKADPDIKEKPEKPEPPPRYIVHDTTTEKLGELLARDDKGILVIADEISGWPGSMERYANKSRSDRAFWLKAYDGGPYSYDRIGRGEIYIPNLSVSLLGGIQPARLAEMQGLTSDGLLQRFLPVMLKSATLMQDRTCDDDAYDKLVHSMIFARAKRFKMTHDALSALYNLHEHLFSLEQTSGGLAPGFQSFIGKLHGLCGSLAVILHMAAHVQDERGEKNDGYTIDAQTIEHTDQLVRNFVLPHAIEFYCGSEGSNSDRIRRIASWILTSGKQRIVPSDLTTNVADCRGLSLQDVNVCVSPLVAGGVADPRGQNTRVPRLGRQSTGASADGRTNQKRGTAQSRACCGHGCTKAIILRGGDQVYQKRQLTKENRAV
jgi:hypothetical protein